VMKNAELVSERNKLNGCYSLHIFSVMIRLIVSVDWKQS